MSSEFYYVTGTVLRLFPILTHLILSKMWSGWYWNPSHFTEMELQPVIGSMSHWRHKEPRDVNSEVPTRGSELSTSCTSDACEYCRMLSSAPFFSSFVMRAPGDDPYLYSKYNKKVFLPLGRNWIWAVVGYLGQNTRRRLARGRCMGVKM